MSTAISVLLSITGYNNAHQLPRPPQMGSGVWTPDGLMERSVLWVSQVWQQLNACLSRLGTHEALLGPQLFLSCPVVSNSTQVIVR